jgi:hypothetical protein
MKLLLHVSNSLTYYELINYYNYIHNHWTSYLDTILLLVPKKYETITYYYQTSFFSTTISNIYIQYVEDATSKHAFSPHYQLFLFLKYNFWPKSTNVKELFITNVPYFSSQIIEFIQQNILHEQNYLHIQYDDSNPPASHYLYYFPNIQLLLHNQIILHPQHTQFHPQHYFEPYHSPNAPSFPPNPFHVSSCVAYEPFHKRTFQNYNKIRKQIYQINEEKNNGKYFFYSKQDQGLLILKKEKEYLQFLSKHEPLSSFFPKLLQTYESGYLLEWKEEHYQSFQFTQEELSNEKQVFELFKQLNYLHQLGSKKISQIEFLNHLKKVFYESSLQSYQKIQHLLQKFPAFQKVNNLHIDSFEDTLKQLSTKLFDYYNTLQIFECQFIHGNLILENIYYDIQHHLYVFTNPRLDYQSSCLFLKEIDYASLLFSIYNYQKPALNSLNAKEIIFDIPSLPVSDLFINIHFNKVHYIMMIFQYFQYMSYHLENADYCLYFYYYGLYLASLM